ncbi:putative deacylase [Bradyrhizobium sp. LA6.10]
MPVINQPALYKFCELECPIDGKNINHTFPGRKDGTFSESLCDAIMNEWCVGADCWIDMHGGNFRETIAKSTIYQRARHPETDAVGRRIAMCFDAEIVLGLPTSYMMKPGRPPTAFAARNRIAVMSEAGANGLLDEKSISFHVDGVLNVARTLGIVDSPLSSFRNARIRCDDYLWVDCPVNGQFQAEIEPGDQVKKGQRLGTIRNLFGETIAELTAPEAGFVLWRITHPSVPKGDWVLTIAVEERLAGS